MPRRIETSRSFNFWRCPDGHVHLNLMDENGDVYASCPFNPEQVPQVCNNLTSMANEIVRDRRRG